jgi:hypothetical protein
MATDLQSPEAVMTADQPFQNHKFLTHPRQLSMKGRMVFREIFDHDQAERTIQQFKFLLNPHRLSVQAAKLENYVQTKYGFERQFWGNGLFVFSYEGRTNVFKPPSDPGEAIAAIERFDITKTSAYQKFLEFQKFYGETGERNIEMFYWGYENTFSGSLNDFSFTYDAERPFHIDYHFKFTGLPEGQVPTTYTYNDGGTVDTTRSQTIPTMDPSTGQA